MPTMGRAMAPDPTRAVSGQADASARLRRCRALHRDGQLARDLLAVRVLDAEVERVGRAGHEAEARRHRHPAVRAHARRGHAAGDALPARGQAVAHAEVRAGVEVRAQLERGHAEVVHQARRIGLRRAERVRPGAQSAAKRASDGLARPRLSSRPLCHGWPGSSRKTNQTSIVTLGCRLRQLEPAREVLRLQRVRRRARDLRARAVGELRQPERHGRRGRTSARARCRSGRGP